MNVRLFVEAGECSPESLDLTPGQVITVGRSRDNGLVIRDDLVSRLHAKIFFEDGRWLIRDFGLNGTKVNGHRVTGAVELHDSAEIQIGQVRLRYSVTSGETLGAIKGDTLGISRPTPPPPEKKPPPSPLDYRATRVNANPPRRVPAPLEGSTDLSVGTDQQLGRSPIPFTGEALDAEDYRSLTTMLRDAVSMTDQKDLVMQFFKYLATNTAATTVAYMNLDPNDPGVKFYYPEREQPDIELSRGITEHLKKGQIFWRLGMPNDQRSESTMALVDAVGIPLYAHDPDGEPIAGVHIYTTLKPFSQRDVLLMKEATHFLSHLLGHLRRQRSLAADNKRLRDAKAPEDIIGDSSAMMAVRQQIGRAAPLPFTVLITGESGSGKELVALSLHRNSPRAEYPLVVVNCGSMTPTTLENELFGYQKGAFVGADHDQPGLFQQADEGTIFLDEVADLSLESQGKLLRIIENKPFRRAGGLENITVDVRVIAATHKDLENEVRAGRFRQDLLFRLKVITIKVPPLREHAEDIIELARFFLDRLGQQCRKTFRLTPAAEEKLFSYHWPGNVRQLRAVLDSAAAMTETEVIDADVLPIAAIAPPAPHPATAAVGDAPVGLSMDELETWAIVKALRHTAGNISQAARVLGISRDTLHTKLKKKNIDRESALMPAGSHSGDTVVP
jgi:DNA-binding NtrC family response regulator